MFISRKIINFAFVQDVRKRGHFRRMKSAGRPKSSKIRNATCLCIIKAQVARYQRYKDSASASNRLIVNDLYWR